MIDESEDIESPLFYPDQIPEKFSQSISELKEAYESGALPRVNAIYSAVLGLQGYLSARNQFMDDVWFDLHWLKKAVEQELSAKLSTTSEKADIGNLVAGLVHFGSSILQAQKAVAEWLGMGETKVRDAYMLYMKAYPHIQAQKASPADFVDGWQYARESGRNCPESFKKAKEAFLKMEAAMAVYEEYLRK